MLLLLLLMNGCAAYSPYSANLPLLWSFFINILVMTSLALSMIYSVYSICYGNMWLEHLPLEGRVEPNYKSINSHNNV